MHKLYHKTMYRHLSTIQLHRLRNTTSVHIINADKTKTKTCSTHNYQAIVSNNDYQLYSTKQIYGKMTEHKYVIYRSIFNLSENMEWDFQYSNQPVSFRV